MTIIKLAKRFLGLVIFPLFFVLFSLSMIVTDFFLRVAYWLKGSRGLFYVIGKLATWLINLLRFFGISCRIDRYSRVSDKPVLILSNHQSLFDIPLLIYVFDSYSPKFVAKKELRKFFPTVSFNLRAGRHALIDRKNPKQALKELIDFAKQASKERQSFAFFPEGTRARDGKLKEFQKAGLKVLLSRLEGYDILPVVIDGAYKLNSWSVPIGETIRVSVGELIPLEQGNLDDIMDCALGQLKSMLARG